MLCGESAAYDSRHPEIGKVCTVQTLPVRNTLLEHCVKEETIGHLKCKVDFKTVLT